MPIKKGSKRTWIAGSPKIEDGQSVRVILPRQDIAALVATYGKTGDGLRALAQRLREQMESQESPHT